MKELLAFVVPCANAVVAIPSAIVANVRAEFAVVVVFPNAIPNQSGGWGSENPLCRPSFKFNFENSGNNTGQELLQF